MFATGKGGKPSANNLRKRVLAPAVKRASASLTRRGLPPLPHLTPHSLRRTFASVLYALDETPPIVMAEMGHTHPGLALRIYARALRLEQDEKDRLRALVDGGEVAFGGRRDDLGPVEALSAETPEGEESLR